MKRIALLSLIICFHACLQAAEEHKGAFIGEIEDDDGDPMIMMETDWISLNMMPAAGSTVTKFVFRPTQNEILDIVQPKNLLTGGGLLQDNLWEQDWRYQELRGKYYDYQITKHGPDEVQVAFETKLVGWIGGKDSGITSKLLENLRIRRTVTLQQGTPYLLFDVELINDDKYAKLPLYWVHNACRLDFPSVDHAFRPSVMGINEIPSKSGSDYVYDFNKGWSAIVSPTRKEGLVYLMDYDYLKFLYNCNITTEEWIYDSLLVLNGKPVKTRIYILPTMGLESIAHACEYFIAQLKVTGEGDQTRVEYKVTSSYSKVRKITFVPELVSDLLAPQPQKNTLNTVEFEDVGIEPQTREAVFNGRPADPLKIKTTAFIETADGGQAQVTFEYFHVGSYSMGANVTKDLKTPVSLLEKEPQKPYVPVPPTTLKLNRTDFKVFACLGNYSRLLSIEESLRSIPEAKVEAAYHPGFDAARTGLTDFPYDFERLFGYRVMVFNNANFGIARNIGVSILTSYLKAGGGLVFGGGENVFLPGSAQPANDIDDYLPFNNSGRLVKETSQLNSPVKEHPIFKGVDLSNMPYVYYVHKPGLKENLSGQYKVLLKAGDQPFVVEYIHGDQRTMIVLAAPFGDKADNPGKPPFSEWSEWSKLYANIVRYAGHDAALEK